MKKLRLMDIFSRKMSQIGHLNCYIGCKDDHRIL